MQSPKFKFLQPDLNEVFPAQYLAEEWKKRVKSQIRRQLIFDPIEYRDIDIDIKNFSRRINKEIIEGRYSASRPKRYLKEKSRGLCRQMTLIHPRDLLVLERLSRSIYYELKNKAPSESAFFEPDDGNFAKGFDSDEFEYGSFASWKKFQKEIFGFSQENNYIVITDVANFYDFINFQHLRNIVASIADIRESLLDLLIFILNQLTWAPDFMPVSQIGMPQIETSATRVLANSMLYEVDKICEHSAISNYARFMDDMDIGVDSIASAKRVVRDVDLALQARQLRLNSSKTKILSQQDAHRHFCILENFTLNRMEKILKFDRFRNIVKLIALNKYSEWLDPTSTGGPGLNSRFTEGNGPKIHKYIFRIIYSAGGRVSEKELLWQIKNNPQMRAISLKYLSISKKNNSNLAKICQMIRRNTFVDDASFVDISGYLLHSRFRNTNRCVNLAKEFCEYSIKTGQIGLYSAIFVASRFLSQPEVMGILENNRDLIANDFWLSRAAAGLSPIFKHRPEWKEYNKYITGLNSNDANDVLNYLNSVMNDTHYTLSLKSYIKSPNYSFPQKLFFPKILILLAVSKNPLSNTLAPSLYKDHKALKSDPFYKKMGFS